jgi:four helix bundle protein
MKMNLSDVRSYFADYQTRAALPNVLHARIIGGQLVRAGTSAGANYRAACRARSKAEVISWLGVVEEEADESEFWLEMIVESGLMAIRLVQPLITEAHELVASDFVANNSK